MKTALALTFIAASLTTVRAATIESPAVGPINYASGIPFFTTTNQTDSVRYQQVYGASDFEGHGSPQYQITEIAFTGGGPGTGPIDVILSNVQIYLSTTSSAVDSLSPVFGDNLGPNTTLVYSGQLHLRPVDNSVFPFQIPLQNPFLYDWSTGNLLLDVRNYQTVPPPPEGYPPRLFEARNTFGDTVSHVAAFDVNSPTAQFLDFSTVGLSTRFTVTGVPEPSSAALLVVGLGALVLIARRRRAQAHPNPEVRETQ